MTDPADCFKQTDGLVYLDTATYGLPPQATVDVLAGALASWQDGSAHWVEDWDRVGERARESFAAMIGAPPTDVALIPAASVGVGTVAASLSPDDRVVVPDDDFTSLLFPLLVAEERGTEISQVPFDDLVDRIEPGVTLVAFSLVQMQTGRVVDLTAALDRAEEVGARVLIDASHGLPFVGRAELARADFVVCVGYKHLLCPRGVAFLLAKAEHHDRLVPWNANWRAATDPYGRYFGGPLTLAPSATRFDVSLAWHPWLGATRSLALLAEWAGDGHLDRPLRLAQDLAGRLGVEWGGSTLVCIPAADADATTVALDEAGIKAGARGPSVRLSTHVYTTEADIDRAVDVLGPLLTT